MGGDGELVVGESRRRREKLEARPHFFFAKPNPRIALGHHRLEDEIEDEANHVFREPERKTPFRGQR
jgi:hypothetical protein